MTLNDGLDGPNPSKLFKCPLGYSESKVMSQQCITERSFLLNRCYKDNCRPVNMIEAKQSDNPERRPVLVHAQTNINTVMKTKTLWVIWHKLLYAIPPCGMMLYNVSAEPNTIRPFIPILKENKLLIWC